MNDEPIYRACCVCKIVDVGEGRFIQQSVLERAVKREILKPFKLTHTYLSKACFKKYLEDAVESSGYGILPEYCKK